MVCGGRHEQRLDRRMTDLREETGRQFSLTEIIVRRWMIWADYLVRMEEGDVGRTLGADGGG